MSCSPSKSLTIVIVNWNSGEQLRDCLASIGLSEDADNLVEEVVVVDNSSTDGSADNLHLPKIKSRTVKNTINRGFAAACNQGALGAITPYVLFLNPDTRLDPIALLHSIQFMNHPENSKVGICGICLLDENRKITTGAARFPTLRVIAGGVLGLSRFLPVWFPPHLLKSDELTSSKNVEQVIGAYFMIRRSIFELCGGFDERFFVYYEEVDLSKRALENGYRSYYVSEITSFHKGGGCSEQVKASRLFYSLRSRLLYGAKHFGRFELMALKFLTALEFPIRILRAVFKGSLEDVRNTSTAYRLLVSDLFGRR